MSVAISNYYQTFLSLNSVQVFENWSVAFNLHLMHVSSLWEIGLGRRSQQGFQWANLSSKSKTIKRPLFTLWLCLDGKEIPRQQSQSGADSALDTDLELTTILAIFRDLGDFNFGHLSGKKMYFLLCLLSNIIWDRLFEGNIFVTELSCWNVIHSQGEPVTLSTTCFTLCCALGGNNKIFSLQLIRNNNNWLVY